MPTEKICGDTNLIVMVKLIDIRCILKCLELSLMEFPNDMLNIAETPPLVYHNWAEDQIELR